MKMIPIDPKTIKPYRMKRNNYAILKEFIDSDLDAVELKDHGHQTAKCCQSCLLSSAKRFGFGSVGIIKRGEHIYLYRKDR